MELYVLIRRDHQHDIRFSYISSRPLCNRILNSSLSWCELQYILTGNVGLVTEFQAQLTAQVIQVIQSKI